MKYPIRQNVATVAAGVLEPVLQEDGLDLGLEELETKCGCWRGIRRRLASRRRRGAQSFCAGIRAADSGSKEHQQQCRSLGPRHPNPSFKPILGRTEKLPVSVSLVPMSQVGIGLKEWSKLSDVLHVIESKHALDQVRAGCGAENG